MLAGTAKIGETLAIADGVDLVVPDLPARLPITIQINSDVVRFRRVTTNRVEIRIVRDQPIDSAKRDLRLCQKT